MTLKEFAFLQCASMILEDQCPPDRRHYLCMFEEDDSTHDCVQCWNNYLRGIAKGDIDFWEIERRDAV